MTQILLLKHHILILNYYLKSFETKKKTGEIYYKASRGSEPDIEFGMIIFCNLFLNIASIYKGNETFIEDKEKINN